MSVVDACTDAAASLGRLRSRPRRGTAKGAVRGKGTRTGRLALVCAEGRGVQRRRHGRAALLPCEHRGRGGRKSRKGAWLWWEWERESQATNQLMQSDELFDGIMMRTDLIGV